MISHCATLLLMLALLIAPLSSWGETNSLDRSLAEICYQVNMLECQPEHQPGDIGKVCEQLLEKTDVLVQAYPRRAEPLLWKGIVIAMQAKYAGFKALSKIRTAKQLLEASLVLDPQSTGGAAYLTLAILYYKVPGWPLGFRSDQQAETYFAKALEVSSHLDTHYRYGEYLLAKKRLPQARVELLKALTFPNREGHPEDAFKKEAIRKLLVEANRPL